LERGEAIGMDGGRKENGIKRGAMEEEGTHQQVQSRIICAASLAVKGEEGQESGEGEKISGSLDITRRRILR